MLSFWGAGAREMSDGAGSPACQCPEGPAGFAELGRRSDKGRQTVEVCRQSLVLRPKRHDPIRVPAPQHSATRK